MACTEAPKKPKTTPFCKDSMSVGWIMKTAIPMKWAKSSDPNSKRSSSLIKK